MRRLRLAGSLAAALALVPATAAGATCATVPEADLRARADLVFTAVALPGPPGEGGALLSPATFAVLEREKGSVEDSVLVETAIAAQGERLRSAGGEGITPAPGEVWRILGAAPGDDGVVETSVCAGSRRVRQATQAELAAATAATTARAPRDGDAQERGAPAVVVAGGALLLAVLLAGAAVAARRRARG